jgi:radical SAM family uncharacterized protein
LTTDWDQVKNLLEDVNKPARYIGDEFNIQIKDWDAANLKVALAFPDVYEIGMSHLGLRILYEFINNKSGMLAERVYAPWYDYQKLLEGQGVRLHTLENKRPLADFNVVGFSLQYELSYTNILTMLSLGGIPTYRNERTPDHPIIIGGGPCTFNPEPVADFFDLFFIGEAEAGFLDVLTKISVWKQSGKNSDKESLYDQLERIPGVYIPSRFEIDYGTDGLITKIASKTGHRPVRAVVRDFEQTFFPKKWLVPYLDIIHDRVAYEIQRGCSQGCRFCQAGMIYRPVREKSPETILTALKELVAHTGYEEVSLTSLSSADYSRIDELIGNVCGCFTPLRVNVSLPSLRTDSFSVDLAAKFQGSHKSSLTFAPEAGTERLRLVINKGVSDADLLNAATAAFKAGWQKLKLYFMIGLPTETGSDLEGIVRLAGEVVRTGKQIYPKGNTLRVTVSISTFVPKAHTPFQWRRQISVAETMEKQRYLQENIRGRHLELSWHNPYMSQIEGVMARGDRRLGRAIFTAWQNGAQFDGWGDQFKYELWTEAFRSTGIDPASYTRERNAAEILPWSHINSGIDPEFLAEEDRRAGQEIFTADCRTNVCTNCGVCPGLQVAPKIVGGNHG